MTPLLPPLHTQGYYSPAPQINNAAWSFLEKHRLEDRQRFRHYAKSR
jgi:hypothetical protein